MTNSNSRFGTQLKVIICLSVAVFALSACNYTIDKVGAEGSGFGKPTADGSEAVPTFSQIAPLLKAKCISCHSNSRRVAGFSVQTWEELVTNPRSVVPGDAENSGLYASVTDDFMPPSYAGVGFLTPTEKDAIKRWINAGALNN